MCVHIPDAFQSKAMNDTITCILYIAYANCRHLGAIYNVLDIVHGIPIRSYITSIFKEACC